MARKKKRNSKIPNYSAKQNTNSNNSPQLILKPNVLQKINKIEDSLVARGIKFQPIDFFTKNGQIYPPSKIINTIFSRDKLPPGEILNHPLDKEEKRKNDSKKISLENLYEDKLRDLREASEIHRQVRGYIQRVVRPGMTMIEICELLENKNRELIGLDKENPLRRGIGFPTGVSLNNVAAHYTPNPGDTTVLGESDIMKVDFGTQINGHIIDCAFTLSFDPKFDAFIEVVKEATNTGIREMGIDVRLCDVGRNIEEAMTADVDIGDKTYHVVPIRNLNGHSIAPWTIHAGKTVPLRDNGDTTKMEEGELYAIETFGSTGNGIVKDSSRFGCSHYMKRQEMGFVSIDNKMARDLLNCINKQFGTLAFCRRWLVENGFEKHTLALRKLIDAEVVEPYPALEDKEGCFTAQFEHTILLRPTCKEVVSRGYDY